MKPVRLGAVSYLNTKPLVYGLDADEAVLLATRLADVVTEIRMKGTKQ